MAGRDRVTPPGVRGRRSLAVAAAVAALGALAVPARGLELPAAPAPVADLAGQCDESPVASASEAGPRLCRSAHQLGNALGHLCRHTPAGGDPECSPLDGRALDPALLDAYEDSWTHRALTLQRELDAGAPLVEAFVPHSHNSYNSVAYFPGLSGLDHNQVLSLTDQLRLDMRGIEIDVHWAPSAEGDPAQGMRAPVMCHGETVDPAGSSAPGAHAGCTTERHLRHGLSELRAWLDANPGEFLILYLENALDDDPAAHAAAAASIAAELGGLVHRPPASTPCAPMPYEASRNELAASGGRVLVVGDCDPGVAGAWGTWVHERGPRWREGGSGWGDDYAPDGCAVERASNSYDTRFVRTWEDGTWLSAMAGGGGELTETEIARMAACGLNFVGFDHLHAEDPSLPALVWSWAPDEPSAAGACAFVGTDDRFHAGRCGERRVHACHGPSGWTVTPDHGPWWAGFDECEAVGADYAVPWNGWELGLLLDAAGGREVWLDYRAVDGDWTPEAPFAPVRGLGARK